MWKTIALTLINRAMPLLLGELWQFLKDAVAVYSDLSLPGAQKRQAVLADAINHARAAGLAISESLLNLGIEAAVQMVRAKAA